MNARQRKNFLRSQKYHAQENFNLDAREEKLAKEKAAREAAQHAQRASEVKDLRIKLLEREVEILGLQRQAAEAKAKGAEEKKRRAVQGYKRKCDQVPHPLCAGLRLGVENPQ